MVTIRPATRDDVPAIVRLLADDMLGAKRERVDELPAYLRAFDDIAADPGNELFVAVQGDEVIGCLQLTIIPGMSRAGMRRAQIESVRVSSAHRGARVGEQLVLDAMARARAAGCGMLQLTSDASRVDARRFYQRLGFEASHVGMKVSLSTD
jgi:ribosomal protein S18 acetylase RimI-like enzyme